MTDGTVIKDVAFRPASSSPAGAPGLRQSSVLAQHMLKRRTGKAHQVRKLHAWHVKRGLPIVPKHVGVERAITP